MFETGSDRRTKSIERVAKLKVARLNDAEKLDLRVPAGNCIQALKGDREAQFSIRVNDQFAFVLNGPKTNPRMWMKVVVVLALRGFTGGYGQFISHGGHGDPECSELGL